MVKEKIVVLIDSGVRDKKTIYTKISEETGIKRSTIRRIAGDLRKDIKWKIKVLTDDDTLKRMKERNVEGYEFIPEKIRVLWLKKIRKDFVKVKCEICKTPLGFVYQFYDGSLICSDCEMKFPESRMVKKY